MSACLLAAPSTESAAAVCTRTSAITCTYSPAGPDDFVVPSASPPSQSPPPVRDSTASTGALGACTTGTVTVTPGETIDIVGGAGGYGTHYGGNAGLGGAGTGGGSGR